MRATIPLVTGRGLDRESGLAGADPQYPIDARNVYNRGGKTSIRPGLSGTPYPALPWGTDLLLTIPVKATGDQLYAVYDRISREIRIFRLDVANFVMQPLSDPANGLWGTLSSVTPWPVISADEANGLVFFAHAEETIEFRLATIYYTPNAADPELPGNLTTLMADLDGDDVEGPVKFFGVVAYLSYMGGWGFGSETDEDRGDVLRLSAPAEPTVWLASNYALAGARKDPILQCIPAENVLAIGKKFSAYRLTGTSSLDFSCDLLDAKYGIISARCAINTGGSEGASITFWYSTDGPRRVTAGGTFPVSQPLELISPLPDDLPTLGPARECFVAFDTDRKIVEWLRPNIVPVQVRTTSFMLSLWNPDDMRWTFGIREQCLTCAGEFLESAVELPPPTGYASEVTGTDVAIAPDPQFRRVSVEWDNNDAAGDERVQIFARLAAGVWSLIRTVAIVTTSPQSVNIDTFLPLRSYEIAIRYVRGSDPGAGYEGNDPSLWTAPTAEGAMDEFDTSSAAITWGNTTFTPPSGPLTLRWVSEQVGATYLLEKDVGAGFVTVAEDLTDFSYIYAVPAEELGTEVTFKVTAKRGVIEGPDSGDLVRFMGFVVGATAWVSAVWSPGAGTAALAWSAADEATEYLLEKNPGAGWVTVGLVAATSYVYTPAAAELGTTVNFRLTPKNGAYSGPVSASQPVEFTAVLEVPTITAITATKTGPGVGGISVTGTYTLPGADNAQLLGVFADGNNPPGFRFNSQADPLSWGDANPAGPGVTVYYMLKRGRWVGAVAVYGNPSAVWKIVMPPSGGGVTHGVPA